MSRIRLAAVLIGCLIAGLRPVSLAGQSPPVAAPSDGSGKLADAEGKALSRPVSLPQFEHATQIASLAAEHGMYKLSQRAIREALAGGPPLDLHVVSGLSNSRQANSRVRMRAGAYPGTNASPSVESVVSQQLRRLCLLWRRGAPADEIYETLAAIVLPEQRPREVFIYDAPLINPAQANVRRFVAAGVAIANPQQPNGDWPDDLARLLVESAIRAGRGAELRQRIESLADERSDEFAASVILAQLSVDDRRVDLATAWRQLERLAKRKPPVHAAPLLRKLAAVIDGPEMPEPMADWLGTMLAEPAAWQRLTPSENTSLQFRLALARWRFSRQDAKGGRENLQLYLRYGATTGSVERVRALSEERKARLLLGAREFARGGLLADALDVLAKYVDATSPAAATDELALAPAWLIVRRLLVETLSAEERYQQLLEWTLPPDDRTAVRLIGCFVPHDDRPEIFATDLYRSWPKDEVSSNFDLLVDAARELQRLDALRRQLEARDRSDNIAAKAFEALINLALGNEDRLPSLKQFLAVEQATPAKPNDPPKWNALAAYLLARSYLRNSHLRDEGRRLAALIKSRATGADRQVLAHLDFELASAIARDYEVDPSLLAGAGFRHWRVAAAGKHWMKPACVPQWWAAHDGRLCCLSDTAESSLVFDSPLLGSGELSVELFRDGVWSSISYGGVELTPHGISVPPPGIGQQRATLFPASALNRPATPVVKSSLEGDVARWTLHLEANSNRVLRNGETIYDIPEPSPAALWPALCAWSSSHALFRGLSFSGDWRIPREVALVQGDRLTGWIRGFYADPAETPFESAARPRTTRRGGRTIPSNQGLSPGSEIAEIATDNQGFPGTPPEPPLRRGWQAINGEVVGAFSLGPSLTRPSPSRLTYYRPLRDGETLRYEFFYQAERTIVHPGLDRLTFLLEPDGVRLHWMTDHPDGEAGGLRLDNVADEPNSRRGPPRLPLVEGEWNRLKLSLAEGAVSLELNGQPIYQRKLENANDWLFSFFHYQDQTEARVRNVVLTGDWPAQLPDQEELFAPGRKLSDAERQAQAKLVGAEPVLTDAEIAGEETKP